MGVGIGRILLLPLLPLQRYYYQYLEMRRNARPAKLRMQSASRPSPRAFAGWWLGSRGFLGLCLPLAVKLVASGHSELVV